MILDNFVQVISVQYYVLFDTEKYQVRLPDAKRRFLSFIQIDLRSNQLNDGHAVGSSLFPSCLKCCSIRNWSYLQSQGTSLESGLGQVFVNALTNYSGTISEPFTLLLS